MSLALIQEAAKEIRRLAIAGSALAVGDFRLKKIAGPLAAAGEKVPVFGQVAKSIQELVDGDEKGAGERLLGLSTLVNAILYTQGQYGVEGKMRGLPAFEAGGCGTRMQARLLKPLVQALTTSGGGRFEVVKSAWESGAFQDLRLIDPAVRALGDVYPELADLVAEKILPGFGPGIVPLLRVGFEVKGKKSDARRLQIMHGLDAEGTLALCKAALDEGAVDVQVAAIGCLGRHEECLDLVLLQAKARNKVLRGAALEALAPHERPEVIRIFKEAIQGKDLDMLVAPLRAVKSPEVIRALVAEGNRLLDALLDQDSESIDRFGELLVCLSSRKEDEVGSFVAGCLRHGGKLGKLKAAKNRYLDGKGVVERLADVLYGVGTREALEALVECRDVVGDHGFESVLRAAVRVWGPERFYREFSSMLSPKAAAGKRRRDALIRLIRETARDGVGAGDDATLSEEGDELGEGRVRMEWHAGWLDAAIAADCAEAVMALARPGHEGAIRYLLEHKKGEVTYDFSEVVGALARCGHPDVAGHFLGMIRKVIQGGKATPSVFSYACHAVRHLSPADLPRLDDFAAELDEKYVDVFLAALDPLRGVQEVN